MHLSARSDYAVRALVELAAASGRPVKREHIATAQRIPIKFLNNILQQLRAAGLVRTLRGADGGYLLTVGPERITLADIIRAVDGPLANVRGEAPENVTYAGSAEPLRDVWIAVRASMRKVLEQVTLHDVAHNELPSIVRELAAEPGAWQPSRQGLRGRGVEPGVLTRTRN
jgi:Rrf2 family protein